MINEYMSLSTRAGFNKSLGHFRLVTGIVQQLANGANLADVVDELEKNKSVEKSQIGPILNAIIRDRMGYSALSFNLAEDFADFGKVSDTVQKWNLVDTVVAYHHPQLGITLVNPKEVSQWEALQDISGEELVVVYAKALRPEDHALEARALDTLRDLLMGKQVKSTAAFVDSALARKPAAAPPPPPPQPVARSAAPIAAPATPGAAPAATPKAAPAAAPAAASPAPATAAAEASGGKARMTPKYSVQVTNELFHNGNVEAWKNIVESYKTMFPDLEVHIFHDGKKVNNINSLFKWGKVNHGDVLLFSVSGEEIKGVAKLQRYLFEGASQRYNNFLKKDINKVLNLF